MNITTATMATRRSRQWLVAATALLLAATALWTSRASSQEGPTDPLTPAELEALVGPIALYPDEVLAVVLPASTYPLEIVQAARFLESREANPALEPDPEWDDSVVALLNYPDVVQLLNDDLDWTWDLGEAVLDDQAAVLDAIQAFRDRAYDAGNLVSDDRQTVTESDGVIAISPAEPEVVYIPYYEPASVVVYQPRPVFHYYPYAYPLYYYPYPVGYRFRTGLFWGVTSAFVIGWDTHYIHLHHHTHYRHPYYRRTFYTPYYARRGINVTINVNNYRNVWRPRRERGARPYDGIRAIRGDDRARRTYDGRRYRYGETSVSNGRQRNAASPPTRERRSATLPRQGDSRQRRAAGQPGDNRREPIVPGSTRRGGETVRPSQPRPGTESNRQRTVRNGAAESGTRRPGTFGGVAPDRSTRQARPGTATRQPADRGTVNRSGPDGARAYRQPDRSQANPGLPGRAIAEPRARENGAALGRPSRQQVTPPVPRARTRPAPQTRPAPDRRTEARPPQTRAPAGGGSRFGGVAAQPQQSRAAPSRAAPPRAAAGQNRSTANGRRMQQSDGGRQSRQR